MMKFLLGKYYLSYNCHFLFYDFIKYLITCLSASRAVLKPVSAESKLMIQALIKNHVMSKRNMKNGERLNSAPHDSATDRLGAAQLGAAQLGTAQFGAAQLGAARFGDGPTRRRPTRRRTTRRRPIWRRTTRRRTTRRRPDSAPHNSATDQFGAARLGTAQFGATRFGDGFIRLKIKYLSCLITKLLVMLQFIKGLG